MQEGWWGRGLAGLPPFAREIITERYAGSRLNPELILNVLNSMMQHATVIRHAEELANLGTLGLAGTLSQPLSDEAQDSRNGYCLRAGDPGAVTDQIRWFAEAAAKTFSTSTRRTPEKILIEVGGTEQFGLWRHNGVSVTQELDTMIHNMPGQIAEHIPNHILRHYKYEGEAPTRYRVDIPADANEQMLVGRRRRGVFDLDVPTEHGMQRVEFFKQSRLLVLLAFVDEKYAQLLREEFNLPKEGPEREAKLQKINNAMGNVIRAAIQEKAQEPLSVCPIDSHLLMRASRMSRA